MNKKGPIKILTEKMILSGCILEYLSESLIIKNEEIIRNIFDYCYWRAEIAGK